MNRYDIAIIGSGPAGISAALTAKIRGKSVIIFGKNDISEKVYKAELICNYPGVGNITGEKLVENFKDQLSLNDLKITQENVLAVYKMGDYFSIDTPQNEYESKTVLVATGIDSAVTVRGEKEFLGRGVSYCATCDGGLYRNKTIAVFCNDSKLEPEVSYLGGIAKKVYYLPAFKRNEGGVDGLEQSENIEIIKGPIDCIEGDRKVRKIILKDETSYDIDGIFFLKKTIPPAALIKGINMENGHISVNRDMSTNIEGVFAAGDCTGRPYQIAKAVGEGNIAVHSLISYLNK